MHLIPFFGQKILSEIKPQDVEAFRNQRTKPNGSKASTQTILRRGGVDTASAMKIVGQKSEEMWKRHDSIEEKDLTQAAQKVHKYLQENKPGTLAEVVGEGNPSK